MNQILITKLSDKNSDKKIWFKFQFTISLLAIITLIIFIILYYQDLMKKEHISNNLIDNYSIYRLYNSQSTTNNIVKENFKGLFRNYRNTKNKFILSYFFYIIRRIIKNCTMQILWKCSKSKWKYMYCWS